MNCSPNHAVEGTAPRGRLAVPSPLTFDINRMKNQPIWKWSGIISIGIFFACVLAVRHVPIMANPNPKHIVVIFLELAAYALTGGVITSKQAIGLSTNMLGMLNVLIGVAWLLGAYGMATFPTQH